MHVTVVPLRLPSPGKPFLLFLNIVPLSVSQKACLECSSPFLFVDVGFVWFSLLLLCCFICHIYIYYTYLISILSYHSHPSPCHRQRQSEGCLSTSVHPSLMGYAFPLFTFIYIHSSGVTPSGDLPCSGQVLLTKVPHPSAYVLQALCQDYLLTHHLPC